MVTKPHVGGENVKPFLNLLGSKHQSLEFLRGREAACFCTTYGLLESTTEEAHSSLTAGCLVVQAPLTQELNLSPQHRHHYHPVLATTFILKHLTSSVQHFDVAYFPSRCFQILVISLFIFLMKNKHKLLKML